MEGKLVGKYVIETRLGGGGMGTVYRARHVTLGRTAAVKVLLPELCANADVVQRFFNEARAATSVRHLGIVEVYDYGRMTEGVAYIAMELLHGDTLSKRMKRGIDAVAALRFVRLICGALGAAHDRGIVHRDLKPDNVFIIRDAEIAGGERIKLLDFGIAKLTLDPTAVGHQTRTGTLIGTPAYMAPEQCRGVQVDWRADIYALGCICYEMFAGRPPFRGEGVGDVLGAHMYLEPSPIAAAPPGVWRLIERMLAKQPADRPQTTGTIIDEIDALLATDLTSAAALPTGPGLAAATTLASSVATVPARPTVRRSRKLAATAVIGAIGIAASVTIAASGGGRDAGSDAVARGASPASVASAATATLDASPTAPGAAGAVIGAPPTRPEVAPGAASHAAPGAATAATGRAAIHIKIDSVPRGAQVILDGRALGATPFDSHLPRRDGAMIFTLHRAGYQDGRVEAAGDHDADRSITLDRRAPPPTPDQRNPGQRRQIGSDEEVNPFPP
jgi:hypothetical protein